MLDVQDHSTKRDLGDSEVKRNHCLAMSLENDRNVDGIIYCFDLRTSLHNHLQLAHDIL